MREMLVHRGGIDMVIDVEVTRVSIVHFLYTTVLIHILYTEIHCILDNRCVRKILQMIVGIVLTWFENVVERGILEVERFWAI